MVWAKWEWMREREKKWNCYAEWWMVVDVWLGDEKDEAEIHSLKSAHIEITWVCEWEGAINFLLPPPSLTKLLYLRH